MIRINLLPGPKGRQAKPQYDVRAQALLGVGLVVVTLAGCWWYSATLDEELEARQTEKSEKTKQVASLNEQVKQVADFEQRKRHLEDKNRIIDQLEKSRIGPVKVLDHVSQSLDPLKIWLVKIGVTGQMIDLEGRALSNDDVVEFVNNLRRTDYFTNIDLQESRSAVEAQVSVYQFKMGFRLKG
ncbi:putative Type IV pilus biogenesis protein PilN [Nitrospira sp. KM1]|uniref:PilN domain-containing protein n=1 Tax=Nitrospira sp. KM1 TaxID=1936990 RepID=UPI0013A70F00|nr:PilN domain-containing protein [Nitrospira sp. KM1]BCA56762.1 putative Type IV pilus biogenesis protein PilN [Nitrospira sp. KM1]